MTAPPPNITTHALERWLERVQPGASEDHAREAILLMVEHGRRSEKPPKWLRQAGVHLHAGVWVLWDLMPGVALILRPGRVITVLTKQGGRRRREEERRRRRCDSPSKTLPHRRRARCS